MTIVLSGDFIRYEVTLDLPAMRKFAKLWRLAFKTSYCSRAFATSAQKTKNFPRKSPHNTSILIPHQAPSACFDQSSSFKIDQSQLTRLVKDKDRLYLQEFGGVNGVALALETDVSNGISGEPDDVARRQNEFGLNTFKPPAKRLFHLLLEASKDLTLLILLVCAGLSPGLAIKNGLKQGWYNGGSPFFAAFLVIVVSAMSRYRQNGQFDKLYWATDKILIHVIRKGRRQQVSIFQIVVGDVVCLQIGNQVPADGLFLNGHSLQVNESSMTGESDPVEVDSNRNPFLFSGTKVADGDARMLVTSVGMNTTGGEMMKSISCDCSEQTPLQDRLNDLTSSIGKVGVAVNFLVLVVLLIRYFSGNTKDKNGNREFIAGQTTGNDIINSVVGIIAATVTIVGVAIPEGLPLAITLTLAYLTKRMMADQAMVRRLWACETMGSATTICTDKTGTLTMNQMKVTKFCVGQDSVAENAYSSASNSSAFKYVLDLIRDGVALNTAGSVYELSLGSEYDFSGSPTEKAILSWAVSHLRMDMVETKTSCKVIQVEAFNSQKKKSGVLIKKSLDDTFHVHWKGAAEMVLAKCSSFYNKSGIVKDLDENERVRLEQIIQGMAAKSLRCIAFAHKQVSEEAIREREDGKKIQEDGLTLLGLVGIKDPCRSRVKSALQACQDAGVNIKMITGDNICTAKAIAIECGILRPEDDASNKAFLEGADFRNYTPEERLRIVEKIRVMARSSPFDKLLMVQCLKQKGHVVAVIGDGTNDAPALKQADIGLSMGIQGPEVTEESSDIIILNNNFASVETMLRWGRCVYNNIQKFIQFHLTMNITALVINFVAAISSGDVPLRAIQLLWVNLIMDALGALALATERPTRELMEKPPIGRTEPLITNVMWRNIVAQATYQMAVLLTVQFKGESIFGVDEAVKRMLIFNAFILCQVFNEFNARKLEKKNVFEGIHKNKMFLGIIFVTIVLQVAMIEFLKRIANTEQLSWGQWSVCVGIAAASWPIGWVVKCIPVPDTPVVSYFNLKTKKLFPRKFPQSTSDHPSSFNIDQSQLTKLVKDKDLGHLQEFGGVQKVISALETDVSTGISGDPDDVSHRQNAFGINSYKKPPAKGFFHFVVEAFKDLTIMILLVCAGLSLGFGIKENGVKEGWYDGGSIFVAVFLVIAVSAGSNYCQNRQFEKLSCVSDNILIDVIRKGRRQQISIFEIVVGDVVCLKTGDQVPADGLFLDGHSLQVDESSMTGESDHVEVNRKEYPFLFSGTKIADGFARMLVTSVGMNTTWGEMMSSISRDNSEQTPLQARLNKLTSSIGKVGLAVAFLVLVVLLIRYFTGNTQDENGNREFIVGQTTRNDIINSVVGIIAAAVTIAVVAIPEGLPPAVTLTLAYSMKRIMADQAMVRKLSACETMGSATTICTDKTGTLTMNQMKVTKFWVGQDSVAGNTCSSVSRFVLDLIQDGVALNTTGSVCRSSLGSEYEFSGSPTEKAILSWTVLQLSMDMEETKKSCEVIQVEAFNSQKKRSGVLIRKSLDNTLHVHWKGAAEMVLAKCSSFYDRSGIVKDLDEDERVRFEQIIQGMAASSLRCIALAHKQVSEEAILTREDGKKIEEDSLTLLGLVGIKDPCRPGVKSAIQACQDAGVNIKMITGDNIFTAKAIATECGILRPGDDAFSGAIVEGAEFRSYTPEERLQRVEKIRVMARSSPFDKLLMVQCLKQKGHVVAVTGDGTNDAPALKEADIGLSMGIQGTEVAKESSDIVILDDNFASVATVLQWGRCVYNNIQKFIQFQLTVNVAALVINFVAAVSSGDISLTAVQLLWVNLIMDTLGALALATERPTRELMEKPPVGRTEPLITNIMWRNIVAQATYQMAILLTLQFKGELIFGVDEAVKRTLIFNAFVLCQVFNEFNARKLEKRNVFEGIHKNKLFLGIIFVTVVLQVVMVEFLKRFANTERLSWGQWGACVGIAAASWPIGWVVKCIPVPDIPIFVYLAVVERPVQQS